MGHNPGPLGQFAGGASKKTLRHWGLAIIVNLGAAIVAALAFGAWQRFQAAKSAATVPDNGGGFYELADDVGYIPRANAGMTGAR